MRCSSVRVESTRAVLEPLDGAGGVGGELVEPHGDLVGVPLDTESERAAAVLGVDADLGGDRQAGELRDRLLGLAELGARGPLGELLAGGFALAQDRAVDGDLEAVAVGVAAAREQLADLGDLTLAGADALLGERERALQGVAAALPRALEALQAGELGARRWACSRISGSPEASALTSAKRERVVADVLDLADVEPAAHHLVDEPRFALDRLPAVGVKAAFDDVAVDLDLGVLVALAQDAALALFDVRGPPRAVEVVQRDRPGLDVGPDAHLLGRADQHRDVPGAARPRTAGPSRRRCGLRG